MATNRIKDLIIRGAVITAVALGIGAGMTQHASAESTEEPGICSIEPLPDGGLSFTYHQDGGCDAAIDYYYGGSDGGSDGGTDGGTDGGSGDELGDWPLPGGRRFS